MSANAELAGIFQEMSAIMELTGANPFRVNAYARVARVLGDLTVDVADIADKKQLVAIEGIGDGTAKKIIEYLDTAVVAAHKTLLDEVPQGLLELLKISGLGPKTVRVLWEQGGVTDMPSLIKKLDSGDIEKLPRMGAKTVANIRESIAFAMRSGKRARLGQALPLAEQIVEYLRRVPGTTRVEYAGSLRRGRETIGDIDILASTDHPGALHDAFQTMPGVIKVLVAGETKSSIRLEPGGQVDLRVVDIASFGAALLYFTGSKAHNVVLRERAVRMKMSLNEYGMTGRREVDAGTEASIYTALDLPYIPPELREDRGELALTETPRLIEIGDIRAELHAHTVASDGRFTIETLARCAADRGYHTVAVTDHSQSSAQANGLSPERLIEHIEAIHDANTEIDGITILAGAEVDILADGRLDYDDALLARLDVVVASPHSTLRQDPDTATKRLLAAIRHPLVHVLGHPTGRILNRREGLHPDMTKLFEAAAEHNTAMEINANSLRLDLSDIHVRAAVQAGALIAVNTDAHQSEHFDELRYGIMTARRGWLEAEQCVNTWAAGKLMSWLRSKR
ncbi:MAG: DNA polymerase/3'-5' exonuclease PolX [Planctomycetota bacterium]|nr:MAG: DNA polymerase/3'-5' exonuclease PolX [Planctomycetota bacterium]